MAGVLGHIVEDSSGDEQRIAFWYGQKDQERTKSLQRMIVPMSQNIDIRARLRRESRSYGG